jgi:hypothetical protein
VKTQLVKAVCAASVILGLALASPVFAETVSYTVGGYWGQFPYEVPPPASCPFGLNGYPGDLVELQEYTGTLDLTPGTYILKINTVLWTINYTFAGTEDCCEWECWSELQFTVDAARSMSVGATNGALAQIGLLEVNWDDDYLSFASGSTTTFMVGTYLVHVTPLPLAREHGLGAGAPPIQSPRERITLNNPPYLHPPLDIYAEFVVEKAEVPVDPTTWGAIKALYEE